MSVIQKDCYFFIEEGPPEVIRCMCLKCHEEKKQGWLWLGQDKGYGDYDCKCVYCDDIIHQRKDRYENETDSATI